MPFLQTSDEVALHYLDVGTGRPVVLVGGFTARASSWTLAVDALVGAGYRALVLDRRHHGDSDFPPYGQRMSRHGADLHEFLAALDLEAPVVVGSSMGGSTILAMVDLIGPAATQQLTRGLVIVDQTPKMLNEDGWSHGFYDLTRDTVEAFVQRFPDGVSALHAPPPPEVLAMLAADPAPPYPMDDMRDLLRDHSLADWRDVVRRVPVPLLALAGRHSPLWPCSSSEWMADNAPRGELVVLEESGHAPMLSEPAAFADVLLGALNRW